MVIELDGGGTLAAIIINDSCTNLALAVGAKAAAMFKAPSVILAVPA